MKGSTLKHLILDASAISSIDSTGIHVLDDLINKMHVRGVKVSIAGAIGPFRDMINQCGLLDKLGVNNFYFDVAEAVASISGKVETSKRYGYDPNQVNTR
jgi:SulP family sulfate permease